MRAILLIAWREYKQYVLSRGFILFLILMPVGAALVGMATSYATRAKPARSLIVLDETGRYGAAIAEELERRAQRDLVRAWDAHVSAAATREALDAGRIPPPFAPAERTRARLAAFAAAGLPAAERALAPHLKPGAPGFTPPRRAFDLLPTPPEAAAAGDLDDAREALRPYLLGEKRIAGAPDPLFAAVVIPKEFGADANAPQAEFWSRNVTDNALKTVVSSALSHALRRDAAERLGLASGALDEVVDIDAPLADFRPDRPRETAALSERDRIETMLPALMTYVLLVVVFSAGQLLLTNTIEERSNKIVEVLLSSVTADELMIGKLLGIAAVGLTLPTLFSLTALLAAFGLGGGAATAGALSALIGSGFVFVYLFYFLCAYLIFAMIFLAIGAMSNSLQDAQAFMGPVMLLVFLPLPFMIMVYQNPNGAIASILTWIPIYTPYAVMMRAASDPPLFEIVGATALMLVFAAVLIRLLGRVFRESILNPAPAKIGDVMRIMRGR